MAGIPVRPLGDSLAFRARVTDVTVDDVEDETAGIIDMLHVSNDPRNAIALVEINGQVVARFSPWHFDHCYIDELNLAGVLRIPVNPPVGGLTGLWTAP